MDKKEKSVGIFPVFKSLNDIYCRVLMLISPFIAAKVFSAYGSRSLAWGGSAFLAAILWATFFWLTPLIKIDADGVHCIRAFKKNIHISWNEVKYVGIWQQVVGEKAYIKEQRFIYFASKPVPRENVSRQFYAPKMTDSFVFAADSPRLRLLIERYLDAKVIKRVYSEQDRAAYLKGSLTVLKSAPKKNLYMAMAGLSAAVLVIAFWTLGLNPVIAVCSAAVLAFAVLAMLEKWKTVHMTRQYIEELHGSEPVMHIELNSAKISFKNKGVWGTELLIASADGSIAMECTGKDSIEIENYLKKRTESAEHSD